MSGLFQYLFVISLKGAPMLADEEDDNDEVGEVLTLPLQAHHAMEKMEEFVHKVKMLSEFDKHVYVYSTSPDFTWLKSQSKFYTVMLQGAKINVCLV